MLESGRAGAVGRTAGMIAESGRADEAFVKVLAGIPEGSTKDEARSGDG